MEVDIPYESNYTPPSLPQSTIPIGMRIVVMHMLRGYINLNEQTTSQ